MICGTCHTKVLYINTQFDWCPGCGLLYEGGRPQPCQQTKDVQQTLESLQAMLGTKITLAESLTLLRRVWSFLEDTELVGHYFDHRRKIELKSAQQDTTDNA